MKMHLDISSSKWQSFYPSLHVLSAVDQRLFSKEALIIHTILIYIFILHSVALIADS